MPDFNNVQMTVPIQTVERMTDLRLSVCRTLTATIRVLNECTHPDEELVITLIGELEQLTRPLDDLAMACNNVKL